MQTVSFSEMASGTKADYQLLEKIEHEFAQALPERIMLALQKLAHSYGGYKIDRLQHSLQSATRAHRAGEDEEIVVAALVHDIGDDLAPLAHSEMAAAVLRPYVSEKTYWIVKTHGIFQMFYYAHHIGGDQHARDRFRDNPWFSDAVRFCEEYDQNCFDPDYDTLQLDFFEPMIRRVFTREPVFGEAS